MYYFASDVHLGADGSDETRRRERRFVAWLDMAARDAEAIFLVGDIFDFWFEYVRVIPKGFVRTLGKLAEIADSGVRIYFFTGNHDMWCYDYFERECGIKVFFSPQRMRLAGRNVLIAHGDNMNIDDKPLLRLMNTIFRSKTARRIFSWAVHPDLALRFGHWWSGKSRKTHAAETLTRDSLGFLIDYARRYEAQHPDTDYIIFGHMHYACDYREDGLRVLFLGSWDDANPVYGVIDGEGEAELKTFES